MSDELCFADEDLSETKLKPWLILLVDDDQDVHISTKFAIGRVVVHGKKLEFLHAMSGSEARQIVASRDDIDLMLLDAIMESTDAGIETAKFTRNSLGRALPIIIMRTGHVDSDIEGNLAQIDYLDDFILKSQASNRALVALLLKWLPQP